MAKQLIYTLFLCLFSTSLFAQEQDLGARLETGLVYRFNKKSNLSFTYRLDLKENLGQFRRSNFSFAYERTINDWLEGEIYYRYITDYDQDKHRFRASLSTQHKIIKKTKFNFRTLLQHDIEYFDGDYLSRYQPEWVWRNRVMVKRSVNKKIGTSIYTEPFISGSYLGFHPYRLRTGATVSYEEKRWKFTAEYFYQNEFYFERTGLHIIGLGATYDITRVVRPKKKKKTK